ncbi:glycosyltransferase family 2 protein [Candidatus Fermentibacteria bacterium]|nr:glycosyltransferase family 2 protein [Candidatus Fermentibacteria bacterium]
MSAHASGRRVVVVMPAYNTARTLAKTVAAIPEGWVDEIVLVNDGSRDGTDEVARSLGLAVVNHPKNRGYGGAQKTGYAWALEHAADIVVLLHSDFQYSPAILPRFVEAVAAGADGVTGSRIKSGDALKGGMPIWKYIPNRTLTFLGNLVFGTRLSEFHNGYRAYSRRGLEAVPFHTFSDRFDFDTQIMVHLAARGHRIDEIPSPTRFADDSSKMSFRQGIRYGLSLLGHMARFFLHRLGIRRDPTLPRFS